MQKLVCRYNYYCSQRPVLLYSTATATATSTSTSTPTDYFANYLLHSLGFSLQQSLSISTKLSHYNNRKKKKVNAFKFQANVTSVVSFYRQHGFDDTHIVKIVSSEPGLLSSNVDKTLAPKFQFLQGIGFSGPDIVRIIYVNPTLLFRGAESSILPAVQVLRKVLVCDTHVVTVLKKLQSKTFTRIVKCLLPNVALLTSYGIPIESIRKLLIHRTSSFLRNPEVFKNIVIRVEKELGIRPGAPVFLYGIDLVCGHTEESIQSKCRIFKSFGWTQTDVQAFIVKNAHCFSRSEESIRKKLNFLMNELRLKPAYLISKSPFLTCSLETRVVPRHKVVLILKEKGLLKMIPSLYSAISMSETRFMNKFVLPFKDVHEVYAKHTGCSIKMLTQDSTYDIQ